MNHHLADFEPVSEGVVDAMFDRLADWDETPSDDDWAFYFEATHVDPVERGE